MTFLINQYGMSIRNAIGAVKFTSQDKLMYNKFYKEGTVNFNGTDLYVPFSSLETDKDLLVGTITINSCTGSSAATSALIGLEIPINTSTIVDFSASLGEYKLPTVASEIVAVCLVGSNLVFRGTKGAGTLSTHENGGNFGVGTVTTNITYKARIISYF